ncbi:MAG TPA: hypothetical protein PKE39_09755 [Ignavibacteria bacterium]|nr:hypothetical protein [Ignavibacteria bacterium]HMQ99296.1 hypothetical protein [Ignavibacteria bacterium]
MKYLITLFALFTIYIYGCGDDNTTNTNNNGNGETVIFSMDSLSITLNTILGIIDSNLVINNAPNIRITFSCSTNADSVNSYALYRVSAADSNQIYSDSTNNVISSLNNNHTLTINASLNYILKFYVQINGNTPYFIRLKNIKVMKL